ncbi:MAG: diguanylate cyclase [Gammaproteobacteria bacterium]
METWQSVLKILVCDDDKADRKLVRAYLQQINDREVILLEAEKREEIQNALDRGRIDVVFMDIRMPEKSGMEWLEDIVKKRMAPVVMLTGFGSEEIAVQALQQGAISYLSKSGLSKEKLVETIDDAIERWRGLVISRANQEQLERLVNIDSLTGLLNRRAILNRLHEHITNARRYEDNLSVLMLDIDHFKRINDKYGHITGDDVLEKVASLFQRTIRDTDTAGRYGGEEFLITLPKADLSSALIVAERIRKNIKATKMKDLTGNVFSITVSQGLATYKPGDDVHSLISRADNLLYQAKRNGRNRIETSGLPPSYYTTF